MGAGKVIATASSEEKRRLALELGADVALDPEDDLGEVDIVFETAGGQVFERSFAALAPFGRIVQYGLSTREKTRISNANLLRTSRGVVGFWLMHCIGRPGMLREPLADLFERAARGELHARVGKAYPLSEVARAHEDLLSRRTSGKLIVDPSIA
jgi:NADPH2:quinone reductase